MISDPIRKVNFFHQTRYKFRMNLFKTTVMTAALCAASPLVLANTAQADANAQVNLQANADTSVLSGLGQNVKSAVNKTGDAVKAAASKTEQGIEHGAAKNQAFTQDQWQGTKAAAADKAQAAREKTAEIKQSNAKNSAQAKQPLHEKSEKTKKILSKKTNPGQAHNTGLNGNVQAELNTPAGKAHISSETDAAIGIK
jgi:hypothetical protein